MYIVYLPLKCDAATVIENTETVDYTDICKQHATIYSETLANNHSYVSISCTAPTVAI